MLPKELERLTAKLDTQEELAFLRLVVGQLYEQVALLRKEVEELKNQLAKNSSNSDKPPSSDGLRKKHKTKSLRGKSGRKPGAQPGHKGKTLKMVSIADHTQQHRLESCPNCLTDLSGVTAHLKDRRQVFDLPAMKIQVREHQIEGKCCPGCGEAVWSEYPSGVNSLVQYGPNIKALGCYLKHYQMISYNRVCDSMQHLFGLSPCPGSLYNAERQAYQALEDFEVQLRDKLIEVRVAGFDETSLRVMKTNHWLHLCSTDERALFHIDPRRGREAMDRMGILPHFDGIAVHDFWSSYFGYDCEHSACNVHLLRELKYITERFDQSWAEQLSGLLLRIKASRKTKQGQGLNTFSDIETDYFQFQYRQIIKQALETNPLEEMPVNNRGNPIKNDPRKLAERLDLYEPQVLHFMWDFHVPFDNNRSERDLRMAKVKQKVSGCFRSIKGARYFARIRSYIVCARKQGYYAFDALRLIFNNDFSLARILVVSE